MELKNKTVVVTGVSKGIGLAIVQILIKKGAKVAGWGRTEPDFKHPNFYFFKADMRSRESVEEAYKNTLQAFGEMIRVLINNAGLGYDGLIEEMPVEQWKEMFDVNVHGIFYASRLVIPNMKIADQGHIINMASIAGKTGIEQMSGYCGTKFAVYGISQAMYKELRNFGIKVTCICPGSVKTNFFDNIESVTAHDRMMMPEDIAETIVHVLETAANYHPVEIEVRPLRPFGKKS